MGTITVQSRRDRRARRQRNFLTAKEAHLAAKLAGLDYKVSGESGALKPPTKGRTWHMGNRKNGHAPPPGKGWDRSGPAYVVESADLGRLPRPVIHHRWQRMMAER